MKNKFNRTIIIVSATLMLIAHNPIPTTYIGDTYGISTCGIEDEEAPFDDEDRKPNRP